MSTTTKTVGRVLVVLRIPAKKTSQLVNYVRSIVRSMTGNPWFPAPVPELAIVQAAVDDLDEAEVATRTRAMGTAANRNARRAALMSHLELLKAYVQSVADADPDNAASIIESSGMHVKRVRPYPARVFAAKPGPNSGTVILLAPKAGNRAGYEWAYSLDAKKTWASLPFTVQTTTTVKGLKRGSTVWFRYRAVTKGGGGDWCDPVFLLVE
jgi:hypothetical protein